MAFVFEVVYHNMLNFGNIGFSIDNLYFEPLSQIYEPDNPLSLGTGRLIINVPESIATLQEAKSYFESIKPKIDRLSLLLSFCAHGDVHFSKCDIFEIIDDKKTLRHTSFLGQRKGVAPGHWIIQRRRKCLEDFISSVFPLLTDEDYLQRKGILDALSYLKEANCFLNPWEVCFEIRYLAFWTAFEIMVHKYFHSNPRNFVLNVEDDIRKHKIEAFFRDFKDLVKKHSLDDFVDSLLDQLRRIFKNESVRKRIRYFLEQNGFEQYKGVVVDDKLSMYRLRSQISHGGVSEYEPIKGELYAKLMRLVDKVVLKTLNYYENKRDCIHPVYLRDDLSATE